MTADGRALIAEAVRMLVPLWRNGLAYMEVGNTLDDLWEAATQPHEMCQDRQGNMLVPMRNAEGAL